MKEVYVVMPVRVSVDDNGEVLTVYVPSVDNANGWSRSYSFDREIEAEHAILFNVPKKETR